MFVQWGFETWVDGSTTVDLNINAPNGAIWLDRITGIFSACPVATATTNANYLRESLTAITFPGASASLPASTGPSQNGRNQSASGNPFVVIMKQAGNSAVNVPVDVAFSPAIMVPSGHLQMVVVSQCWGPNGQITNANEALDTEAQLTIFYRTNPDGKAFQ